jgi:pyruvate dehydrogenase E1 component beta subunit
MRRDKSILLIGEDVGRLGDQWGITKGLLDEFGPERVIQTPISEAGFIGACCTLAATGWRPIVELMYIDFCGVCMDQIYNVIAKMRYASGGKMKIPVVIRTACGVGTYEGYHHSQVLYSIFAHVPGIKIVTPSSAYDAKGLLISSIRSDDPVLFFEHMSFITSANKEYVPAEEYSIPFGEACLKKEGRDITVVATMLMLRRSLEAANKLEADGVSVEVIDPRTLVPFDAETVIKSVKKTGRLIIVDEDYERCGMASQIAAVVAEQALDYLKAPIKRLAEPNVPIAYSPRQIDYIIPSETKIVEAIKEVTRSSRQSLSAQ